MPARAPRHVRAVRAVLALILLLSIAAPVSAENPDRFKDSPPPAGVDPTPEPAFVPGELVVQFQAELSLSARTQALEAVSARLGRPLLQPGLVLATLPPSADVQAAAAGLSHRPGVVYAEPNFIFRTSSKPNDPRYGEQWALSNADDEDIDAPAAWNITTGSSDVVVAIVDSGVDYAHPDLAPNIWRNAGETLDGKDNDHNGFIDDIRGWDFVGNDNDPMDRNGHGTHVASIVGARGNNGAGISGVNWKVSLMPVRAGDASGNLTNADVVDAFAYACSNNARVINGSFGGPNGSQAVRDAILACPEALFVFAAGNGGNDGVGDDNDGAPAYPCSFTADNILCVAATGRDGQLTAFSNYGATAVDLAAPGDETLGASYQRVVFGDGFESGLEKWAPGRNSGLLWSRTSERATTGSYSATDSAGGNYRNNSNTWLRTADAISLAGGTGCQLDYALEIETESGLDGMGVEVKAGSGAWEWISGWSGTSDGAFFTASEDLQDYDGVAAFRLRFRFLSDESVTYDGVHLDDVQVRCRTGSHSANDFVKYRGTSMATPHVAGVAALVLAAHPHLHTESVRQAVLDGVDPLPAGSTGKVASDGRLNALGALSAVETTMPIAQRPTQHLIAGLTVGTSTLPIRVSWPAATDPHPSSGIFQYRLQRRKKNGGTWGAWSSVATTVSRSTTLKLAPGTYQFRVRAQDRAGNWSAWRTGIQFRLKDPQGDAAIAFAGAWNEQAGSSFYDGSTRYTGVRGRTATHTFTGREVAWVGTRGPTRGRAKVYLDGTYVATIDLYSSTTKDRRVLFLKKWDASGEHTIQVRVIPKSDASSGSRVDLDAFATLH